jgi:hypothetical protein
VAVAIVLAACGGDTPITSRGGARAAVLVPEDPCGLVSVEDVEAATESTVVRNGLVPDERLFRPEEPELLSETSAIFLTNPCEYVTVGRHASIVVYADPEGGSDFGRERDRDPINTDRIEGIGDEAFAQGLASLHVLVGDGCFVLVTQHGAGWPGIRDLKELAIAALD